LAINRRKMGEERGFFGREKSERVNIKLGVALSLCRERPIVGNLQAHYK